MEDVTEEKETGGTNEWELSKENVQPLKNGRKVANLSMALQTHPTVVPTTIKEEKQAFEVELRTYSGTDPLDVWDRYINWIEQNYPKGGKDSHLMELLERCLTEFKDNETYKNDPRYLNAWLKMIQMASDAVEIFSVMHGMGIGVKLAAFYEAWALELEQIGSYKKADSIFQRGDSVGAQPLEKLRAARVEFQARVARRLASGGIEEMEHSNAQPQRDALGELRPRGKQHSVGTARTGSARLASKGGIKMDQPLQNNRQGMGFRVFTDENSSTGVNSKQSGEWQMQGREKENQQKAGVWTDARMKQRTTGVVPVNSVSTVQQPTFQVHQDTDVPMMTPRKLPAVCNVLSAKKVEKPQNLAAHFQEPALRPGEKPQMPMYSKHKVYTGTGEFSFEELRAAMWRKRAAERRKQMEMEQLKDEVSRMKQMLQNMQQGGHPAHPPQPVHQAVYPPAASTEDLQEPAQISFPGPQGNSIPASNSKPAPVIKLFQDPAPAAVQVCSSSNNSNKRETLSRQLNFSQTTGLADMLSSQCHIASQSASSVPVVTSDPAENISLRRLPATQASTSFNRSGQLNVSSLNNTASSGGSRPLSANQTPDSSTQSFSRGLSAPSPTVNTREAVQVMMGLFNQSLHTNCDLGTMNHSQQELEGQFINSDNGSHKAAPFHIFCEPNLSEPQPAQQQISNVGGFTIFNENQPQKENGSQLHGTTAPTAAPGFQVFDDDAENKAPSGYHNGQKRQGLRQALIPSTDVPMAEPACPDDEEQMDHLEDDVKPLPMDPPEPMDTMAHFDEDMTFAPGFSSTRNFTQLAHMVSTPFNPVAPSFAPPPVSHIKPAGKTGAVVTADQTFADQTQGHTSQHPSDSSDSHQVSLPSTTPHQTDVQDRSNGLSPILEASEESVKSNGSLGTTQCNMTQASTASTTIPALQSHPQASATLSRSPSQPPKPARSDLQDLPEALTSLHVDLSQLEESLSSRPPIPARCESMTSSEVPESQVLVENKTDGLKMPDTLSPMFGTELSGLHHLLSPEQAVPRMTEPVGFENVEVPRSMLSMNTSCPQIDMTHYVEPEEDVDLGMSIRIDPLDPFDEDTVRDFIANLAVPLSSYPNYYRYGKKMPHITTGCIMEAGDASFQLKKKLGEGGFASVYEVETKTMNQAVKMVAKIQRPACPLEFYITTQLHRRLRKLHTDIQVDMSLSYMKIERASFFENGSCLINEYIPHGTLLDFVNDHKTIRGVMDLSLAVKLTVQLIYVLENLHACGIIHGDIKPDNFLLLQPLKDLPLDRMVNCVRLIDFGRSIDMTMFPPGTSFLAKVKTEGFQCVEMMTNRPWTYQTDLYGLAATVIVILKGRYMTVRHSRDGRWTATHKVRNATYGPLFDKFFDTLLNIPSCDEIPDLAALRQQFQQITDVKP